MSARLDEKWLSYGQKRMPKYGIIDILRATLACNLVKYQHFSMRPGLFDKALLKNTAILVSAEFPSVFCNP